MKANAKVSVGTGRAEPMSSAYKANACESDMVLERSETFAPLSARRLLLLGGIGLILIGMIFGDVFAVFVLHQNAARVGASLSNASHAALAGDAAAVLMNFQELGSSLENRGTKVDTHVHMIAFGYLALMLALLAPRMALSPNTKERLAWVFLCGAGLLALCVFLIHYVGLAHSPLKAIGWASIFADLGGLLIIVVVVGYLYGLVKYSLSGERAAVRDDLLADSSVPGRLLLAGGLFLVLLGLLHGSYYAAVDLYRHEALDYSILSRISAGAAAGNAAAVDSGLAAYGQLQGDKAVKIAAHAHIIEFGLLSMLLAFFQPYVNLRETWKRRWAIVLLFGSVLLPVCVLLELKYALVAGGLADGGGLLVIVALLAMWIGILRYTGELDAGGTS
jgi:heme/copper-type cytochrome/quinol oxidase subunit 4